MVLFHYRSRGRSSNKLTLAPALAYISYLALKVPFVFKQVITPFTAYLVGDETALLLTL